MWAISQLAVTGADEPRVVQLGASLSPWVSGQQRQACQRLWGNHSLQTNEVWTLSAICKSAPFDIFPTCSAVLNVTSSRGWGRHQAYHRATGVLVICAKWVASQQCFVKHPQRWCEGTAFYHIVICIDCICRYLCHSIILIDVHIKMLSLVLVFIDLCRYDS